jgi:tripartite ATP-independent transporter DctM subunit
MIIPPSALAVILAAVAKVSVGKVLVGGVIPGIILACLYIIYIVGRCTIQPSIAPAYNPEHVSFLKKIKTSITYLFPMGLIIFSVIGFIFFGIATPTEAAGIGAFLTFILAAIFKKFNFGLLEKSVKGTIRITGMLLIILTGSVAFSQVLAYSGATATLVKYVSSLKIHPIFLILCMQFVIFILGTFMEAVAIMMITLPIYLPVIKAIGFNEILFILVMLINLEVAMKTPPFGFLLFVMKSVSPPQISLKEIYLATFPFILIDIIGMGLLLAFPVLALWLPSFVAG